MKRLAGSAGAVAIALIATACVAASSSPKTEKRFRPPTTTAHLTTHPGHKVPAVALAVPARLTAAGLDLHAGPLAVPLLLQIPTLDVNAAVLGVGIASTDAMDAPEGHAGDPVWQQAFWYRGSAIPGARSTALIAGHIDGPGGSSAVFTHLGDLRAGDPIVIHDTRSGLDVHFAVTATRTYTLAQAADPSVLKQIYGVGPVVGEWPQPSADGLSHLTLVTCAGTFRSGTHDHRLAVYAIRTG